MLTINRILSFLSKFIYKLNKGSKVWIVLSCFIFFK